MYFIYFYLLYEVAKNNFKYFLVILGQINFKNKIFTMLSILIPGFKKKYIKFI